MTRVKICGLTRAADAHAAIDAGAFALGVVFAPSPRQVTVRAAAALFRTVTARVTRVGVFVDPVPVDVAHAVEACALDWVQLSGHETAREVEALRASLPASVSVVKAIHVGSAADVTQHADFPADLFLLDAPASAGALGGTGRRFDLDAARALPWTNERVGIAGGLTPGNVADVVVALQPAFVDVSSGVESSPGVKDAALIARFIAAAHAARTMVPA